MPNLWVPKHDDAATLVTDYLLSAYRLPIVREGVVIGFRYIR